MRQLETGLSPQLVKGIALRSIAVHVSPSSRCRTVEPAVQTPVCPMAAEGVGGLRCFLEPLCLRPALTPGADPGGACLRIVSRFSRFDHHRVSSL